MHWCVSRGVGTGGPTHAHLHPVDAPLGPHGGVLLPVVARAGPAADAGEVAGARVQPERQVLRVDVVDDWLHAVGEVVHLGVKVARRVTTANVPRT